MVRISLIILLCAVFLFADDVPDEGSLYWGGRLSLLAGSAWNDKSVKGVFSPTYKEQKMKVTQSCPTLCVPMDYIIHGIL